MGVPWIRERRFCPSGRRRPIIGQGVPPWTKQDGDFAHWGAANQPTGEGIALS